MRRARSTAPATLTVTKTSPLVASYRRNPPRLPEEAHPHHRLDQSLRHLDPLAVGAGHDDRHVIEQRVPDHPLPHRRARRPPARPPSRSVSDAAAATRATSVGGHRLDHPPARRWQRPPPRLVPPWRRRALWRSAQQRLSSAAALDGDVAVDRGPRSAPTSTPNGSIAHISADPAAPASRSDPHHGPGSSRTRRLEERARVGAGLLADHAGANQSSRNVRSASVSRRGRRLARSNGTHTERARDATVSPSMHLVGDREPARPNLLDPHLDPHRMAAVQSGWALWSTWRR